MKKSVPVLLFVSLILGQGILTACSNQESVVNVEVENISLDKSTTSIKVGETLNLSATITPENATNKEITYSSSDQKVATISGSTLTAVAAGSVTVTATANNGKFDSFILNVIEEEDTSKIDLTTLLNSLDKDEYCLENVVTKEKYGLSDVNNVGVNKKISEQTLYEIPADDEFKDGKIIDVDSLTLDDISKFGFSELNDYSKLQGALNLAKEVENGKKVKIKLSSPFRFSLNSFIVISFSVQFKSRSSAVFSMIVSIDTGLYSCRSMHTQHESALHVLYDAQS